MENFLVDGHKKYSYVELLENIHQSRSYYPFYKEPNLFLFFTNLIKALSTNSPITLLDADLNVNEIKEVDDSYVNKEIPLVLSNNLSIEEIIQLTNQSTSQITIFTSGTTGQPKKVVHSAQNLMRSVRLGDKYKNQIWAFAYNPTHMAGLQVFFQAFLNGNCLVNVFNRSRDEVFSLIESECITHISATPTFYRLLLPFKKEYSNVQRVTLGGEKSDAKLYECIKQIFPQAKLNNVYASTEAGSLFASKGDSFQIPESMRDKFKVVEGELLIHNSLLGKSENFKFEDDFYPSGDLVEWVDEKNGLFKFKSRKNELINVGGYKVNPEETEQAILNIEGVIQALVYGKPNSILGNVLCAEVKISEDANLTEIDIRKHLKDQLQDFKIPRRIKFVETFSLTRTGKIKRS